MTIKLPKDEQQILENYFVKTNLITEKECAFIYVQGAKGCAELMKKLGARHIIPHDMSDRSAYLGGV